MRVFDRRAFVKRAAMLSAAVAAGKAFPLPAAGRTRLHAPEELAGGSAGDGLPGGELVGVAPQGARRGAEHPFFAGVKNRPEVIAHRGGAGQWPGETLHAYERALKLGVDVIELDIHRTSDGELVLMHNSTVDETTDGTGPVRRFTLKELKRLDAGYRWSSDGGKSFPFRGKGITVATLKEVFEAFPRARMNIEIKQSEPSLIEPFCKLIRDHGLTEKVLVASFRDGVMKEFRRRCPEVATSASTPELLEYISKNNPVTGGSYRPNSDALQVKDRVLALRVVTKRFIERAHGRNLQVHAWTVNDLDGMRRLVADGVDGIITDYPGPLLALLDRVAAA